VWPQRKKQKGRNQNDLLYRFSFCGYSVLRRPEGDRLVIKRVAIFVDVQNIYYTTRQSFGGHFDYNAFWRKVTADRQLVKATAFAIDRGDPKQQQFQNILRGIGFEVKLKPFISRSDGSAKGDWDVGITLDVLDVVGSVDVVVLASGDGDFDLLVHRLRERYAIDVEIYGAPQFTANTLMRAASRFIPIDESLVLKVGSA
jgi:uncharacterized LabA/DUF88 family protein